MSVFARRYTPLVNPGQLRIVGLRDDDSYDVAMLTVGVSEWSPFRYDRSVFNAVDVDYSLIKEKKLLPLFNHTGCCESVSIDVWWSYDRETWGAGPNDTTLISETILHLGKQFQSRILWINPDKFILAPFIVSFDYTEIEPLLSEDDNIDEKLLRRYDVQYIVPKRVGDHIEFEEVKSLDELKRCLVAL